MKKLPRNVIASFLCLCASTAAASYDLYLIPGIGDGSLAAAQANAFLQRVEAAQPPAALDPSVENRKRGLASALRALNPALEVFRFDYAAIADLRGISEERARLEFRHIELNGPEDGNGIQITLFDGWATITVPYWHKGSAAKEVFQEIWAYCSLLRKRAGYLVYDPQLDRVLDPTKQNFPGLQRYEAVAEKFR